MNDTLLAADRVGVELKQHVGAPCEPLVAVGQRVKKGQPIGRPPMPTASRPSAPPSMPPSTATFTAIDNARYLDRKTIVRFVSMATPRAIGAIELSSIGIGYQIEDEMLKAASVDVLIARTICSGKYLIVLGGSVSDVEASIAAGLTGGQRGDHRSPADTQRASDRCSRRWGNRWRSGRKRPGRWA